MRCQQQKRACGCCASPFSAFSAAAAGSNNNIRFANNRRQQKKKPTTTGVGWKWARKPATKSIYNNRGATTTTATHHAHIRTAISRRRRRQRRGQRSRRQFVVGVQTDANLGELWERESETGWAAEKCRLGEFSLLWLSRNKWERAWSTFLPLSRPLSISLGRCRIFADAGQLLTVNALLPLPLFWG